MSQSTWIQKCSTNFDRINHQRTPVNIWLPQRTIIVKGIMTEQFGLNELAAVASNVNFDKHERDQNLS